jgi:hypothetical protein
MREASADFAAQDYRGQFDLKILLRTRQGGNWNADRSEIEYKRESSHTLAERV